MSLGFGHPLDTRFFFVYLEDLLDLVKSLFDFRMTASGDQDHSMNHLLEFGLPLVQVVVQISSKGFGIIVRSVRICKHAFLEGLIADVVLDTHLDKGRLVLASGTSRTLLQICTHKSQSLVRECDVNSTHFKELWDSVMQGSMFFLLDNPLSVILALRHRSNQVRKFADVGTEFLKTTLLDLEEVEDFSFLGETGPTQS